MLLADNMKLQPLLHSIFSSTSNDPQLTPPLSNLPPFTTTEYYYSPETALTLSLTHIPLPFPTTTLKPLALHNHLLYTSTDNNIHVINTSTFTLLHSFTVPSSVKSVTFNNGCIYTAHHDSKIRVWKLINNKHKHIATLPTLQDILFRSVFLKNYVSVRRHRKKLWIEHYDVVSGLVFINSQLLCSVSWDKYLKIWRTSDFKCMQSIKAHDDAINAVSVSPDGVIFTGSSDRMIKVWGNVNKVFGEKYEAIATLDKHKCGVNALVLNDDGLVMFSGGSDGGIIVWEREQGSNGVVLRGHCKAVFCLVSVFDLLFSGSADRTVRIWKRGCEGEWFCFKVLGGYERPVRSLVVDCDYKSLFNVRVFSESCNGVIRVITVQGLNISDSMSIHLL